MTMIFVNLPVKDVSKSRTFFGALGFGCNEDFSDQQTACMVVDDNIFVMLLEEARFKEFINDEISDATRTTEVLTCLSAESRQAVDAMVARAVEAGGREWKPSFEMGPMYGGSFQDIDGHVWELMSMEQ